MSMLETVLAIASCLLLLVGLPIVLLVIKDRVSARRDAARSERMRREHPERFPDTPEYEARLRSPQVDALEAHFGRKLPESFKDLHRSRHWIESSDFVLAPPDARMLVDTFDVNRFLPADLLTLEEFQPALPDGCLPFATDVSGDPYYIPLSEATETDGPVDLLVHLGEDVTRVADSLKEFLSWRRMSWEEAEELDSQ